MSAKRPGEEMDDALWICHNCGRVYTLIPCIWSCGLHLLLLEETLARFDDAEGIRAHPLSVGLRRGGNLAVYLIEGRAARLLQFKTPVSTSGLKIRATPGPAMSARRSDGTQPRRRRRCAPFSLFLAPLSAEAYCVREMGSQRAGPSMHCRQAKVVTESAFDDEDDDAMNDGDYGFDEDGRTGRCCMQRARLCGRRTATVSLSRLRNGSGGAITAGGRGGGAGGGGRNGTVAAIGPHLRLLSAAHGPRRPLHATKRVLLQVGRGARAPSRSGG